MPKVAITQSGRIELAIAEAREQVNLRRLIRNKIGASIRMTRAAVETKRR